jgi:hypothetical protein
MLRYNTSPLHAVRQYRTIEVTLTLTLTKSGTVLMRVLPNLTKSVGRGEERRGGSTLGMTLIRELPSAFHSYSGSFAADDPRVHLCRKSLMSIA